MNKYFFVLLFVGFFSNSQTKVNELIVFFDTNSSVLSNNEKAILMSTFSHENLFFDSIAITGFCDDVGSFESNDILSMQRAKSVSDFIKNQINLPISSEIGKGEIAFDKNTTLAIESIRKNNRKVVISYSISEIKEIAKKTEPQQPVLKYKTLLNDLVIGDKVIINDLVFKGNLTVFQDTEAAEKSLEKIVVFLNKNPKTKIEIQGHVCCISSSHTDAFDRTSGKTNLSHTRAKKIFDYFVEKGIDANRMLHNGYGRKFPIEGGNESDNKRVEILITAI